MESRRVPVWVELLTSVEVLVADGADPTEDDLVEAVKALLPDCDIVTAIPPSQVQKVMDAHAADLQRSIDETRRLLNIAIGAIVNEVSTPEGTASALRNIEAMLPRPGRPDLAVAK